MGQERKVRTEFGFERTIADGPQEQLACKTSPGYLIPSDLDRMAKAIGFENTKEWALQHLLASPGMKIGWRHLVTGKMEVGHIRILVPARNGAGHCEHFVDGKCAIHEAAPFGCAFFDCSQSAKEYERRSIAGLLAIQGDWIVKGPYSKIWLTLDAVGRHAVGHAGMETPSICCR